MRDSLAKGSQGEAPPANKSVVGMGSITSVGVFVLASSSCRVASKTMTSMSSLRILKRFDGGNNPRIYCEGESESWIMQFSAYMSCARVRIKEDPFLFLSGYGLTVSYEEDTSTIARG